MNLLDFKLVLGIFKSDTSNPVWPRGGESTLFRSFKTSHSFIHAPFHKRFNNWLHFSSLLKYNNLFDSFMLQHNFSISIIHIILFFLYHFPSIESFFLLCCLCSQILWTSTLHTTHNQFDSFLVIIISYTTSFSLSSPCCCDTVVPSASHELNHPIFFQLLVAVAFAVVQ